MPNVKGLGLETMGAMGKFFKTFTQQIAKKIQARTNIPYTIIINRIRTRITSKLIKHNVNMIRESFNLTFEC